MFKKWYRLSSPTKEIVSNISSITSTLTTFSTTQVSNNADNLEKVGLGVDVQKMVQKFESSTTSELCKPAATITHDQNTVINKKETTPIPEAVVLDTKPKAKKRVSLADYKSLRRVSSSNPTSAPSTPILTEAATVATPSIMTATPTTKTLSNVLPIPPPKSVSNMPMIPPVNKQTSSDLSVKKSATSEPLLQRGDSEPLIQQGGHGGGQAEEQGTPTQDEQQPPMIQSSSNTSSTSSKPVGSTSLNTLPLFDKLELAQQEIKRKASQNSYISLESNTTTSAPSSGGIQQHQTPASAVLAASRSPVFEPKREDLTSRLQKEFGLLVDTDTTSDDQSNNPDEVGGGDATPEEDGPPPPPPSGSSGSTRFLPSQIPSYTTQGQTPSQSSYPASTVTSVASQPPPVPHVHHYNSSVNRAKYPPPPPPPSSMTPGGGIGGYQFPPPPPPTISGSFGKDDHSQPPP